MSAAVSDATRGSALDPDIGIACPGRPQPMRRAKDMTRVEMRFMVILLWGLFALDLPGEVASAMR